MGKTTSTGAWQAFTAFSKAVIESSHFPENGHENCFVKSRRDYGQFIADFEAALHSGVSVPAGIFSVANACADDVPAETFSDANACADDVPAAVVLSPAGAPQAAVPAISRSDKRRQPSLFL